MLKVIKAKLIYVFYFKTQNYVLKMLAIIWPLYKFVI